MSVQPLVELREAGKRYGSLVALQGIRLQVFPGQSIGITGRSGSGKSTLARLLTLHLQPCSGQVLVEGRPADGLEFQYLRAARRKLQLVSQDPASSFQHHWRLWRVVSEAAAIDGHGAGAQRDLARTLIDSVGLSADWIDRTPMQLSGGQRLRIAIARALGAGPKLVVLDESLSGLDLIGQGELIDLMNSLRQDSGIAVITVSHDLRLLRRIARDVVFLDGGRIVDESSEEARKLVESAYCLESKG